MVEKYVDQSESFLHTFWAAILRSRLSASGFSPSASSFSRAQSASSPGTAERRFWDRSSFLTDGQFLEMLGDSEQIWFLLA